MFCVLFPVYFGIYLLCVLLFFVCTWVLYYKCIVYSTMLNIFDVNLLFVCLIVWCIGQIAYIS